MYYIKYYALAVLMCLTLIVWCNYFTKRNIHQNSFMVEVLTTDKKADIVYQSTYLSDEFWQWEAKGRIQLVDLIMDEKQLNIERENTSRSKNNLNNLANKLIRYQLLAYGVETMIKPPKLIFTPLRLTANGLYVPSDKTIYINSKIKWEDLSYERFIEVVLHENMHHILTYIVDRIYEGHPLKKDFMKLAVAAQTSQTLANINKGVVAVNIQELVAYKAQRAARYAGITGNSLSAWEMSIRTQEIRLMIKEAGFINNY